MKTYDAWGYDEVLPLMQKSAEWHEARRHSIGASDANIIMGGNADKLLDLYLQKRGEGKSVDLSGTLPVIMGIISEPLNRYYYTLQTGRAVTRAGEKLTHPAYKFLHLSLDGLTTTEAGDACVYEAKHVNPFNFEIDMIRTRYAGQLQAGMLVSGLKYAILSILVGTLKWVHVEVPADNGYQAELLQRCIDFWDRVESGTPPAGTVKVEAPIIERDAMREVDMNGNNAWAVAAHGWLTNRDAAADFKIAVDDIKDAVEKDVKRAWGYGIQAKRDTRGAIRITPKKG